jgi:alpha-tubulin suppressor-like RCC1 family protein
LSHLGVIYTWGWNKSGESALGSDYENIDYVYEPTKVDGHGWVDVAMGQTNLYALKNDGTLWFVGLDTIIDSRFREFTQMGADTDWLSINPSGNGSPFFLKTDGSIWSRARAGYIAITNREEYKDSMVNLSQIVPLYKIRSASSNGDMSVAVDTNNNLLSWGSNRLSDLGRSESLGYIAPIELSGEFTNLQSAIFRSIVLGVSCHQKPPCFIGNQWGRT